MVVCLFPSYAVFIVIILILDYLIAIIYVVFSLLAMTISKLNQCIYVNYSSKKELRGYQMPHPSHRGENEDTK